MTGSLGQVDGIEEQNFKLSNLNKEIVKFEQIDAENENLNVIDQTSILVRAILSVNSYFPRSIVHRNT